MKSLNEYDICDNCKNATSFMMLCAPCFMILKREGEKENGKD